MIVTSKESKAYTITDKEGYYLLDIEPLANDTIRVILRTPYAKVKPSFYIA